MKVFKVLILLASMFFMGSAYADSDGVYCIGKDYVAIEARGLSISADGPSTYIITIDSEGKLSRHVLSTPPNLNKKLRCEEGKIVFSDGHLIDVGDFKNLSFSKAYVDPGLDFSDSQLPYLRESDIIKLQTTDQSHLYSLVLNHNIQAHEQGMLFHYVSARVVKVTRGGDFISSKLLAEGVALETVD
jgi:hypothetical protein